VNDEKRVKSFEQIAFEIDTAPEIVRNSLRMGTNVTRFLNDKYLVPVGEPMSVNQMGVVAAAMASMVDFDTAIFLLEGEFIAPDVLDLIGAWHKKRVESRSGNE
jgi:hypothetical protein